MVEMLNLQDDEHHGEYESDGESTIVPDNRSVTDQEVVDLTNEGNGTGENNSDNSESLLNSTEFSSNDMPEGSLFVEDDYVPSQPPSPQDGRRSWDIASNQTSRATVRSGGESDLFIGSAPTYTNETPSCVPTFRQSSLGSEIEAIDLTGPDDIVDSFLPSDSWSSPPISRKRPLFKVEDGEDEDDEEYDEDDEDDTSTGTPSISKRVRTLSPASLLRTGTGGESIFFSA
jgi:hypothetical protein